MSDDLGPERDLRRVGVREIVALGPREHRVELRLAPREDGLHLLGRLELVVLAQVAVAARDGDVLGVLRNLVAVEVFQFRLAPLEAGPGDDELGLLRRTLVGADDHRLHVRVKLDDRGEQRALVELLEHRAEQDRPHDVAHVAHRRVLQDRGDERLVAQDQLVELVPFLISENWSFSSTERMAMNNCGSISTP